MTGSVGENLPSSNRSFTPSPEPKGLRTEETRYIPAGAEEDEASGNFNDSGDSVPADDLPLSRRGSSWPSDLGGVSVV